MKKQHNVDPVDEAALGSEKALADVSQQREKLAKMRGADPHRPHEEARLDTLIDSSALAEKALSCAMDDEEADKSSE